MSWSQADVWRLFSSCGEQSLKDVERIELNAKRKESVDYATGLRHLGIKGCWPL